MKFPKGNNANPLERVLAGPAARLPLLFVLLSVSNLWAEVTFTALGPGTGRWSDVTDDGKMVVGLGYDRGSSFVWTAETGLVQPEGPPRYIPLRVFVSGDGSVITGTDGDSHHAFRTTSIGELLDLGTIAGRRWSASQGVSRDGRTIVGTASFSTGSGYPDYEAFRWTVTEEIVGLGTLGGNASQAFAVSADGAVITGRSRLATGVTRAFRWTQETAMVPLSDVGSTSHGDGISSNGSIIVGGYQDELLSGDQAFRWTAMSGLVGLGRVRGNQTSVAKAVSDDGSVVVGLSDAGGFIWTPDSGMRDLLEVLAIDYGIPEQIAGWSWLQPLGITPDGRFITGIGDQGSWLLDRGANPPPIKAPPPEEPEPEPEPGAISTSLVWTLLGPFYLRIELRLA